MTTAALEQAVLREITARAPTLGLDPAALRATYVINPGGFVTDNFTVTDGACAVHVKLTTDATQQRELERWAGVGARLSERYHAPRILDRISVGDHHGLIFEWVPGRALPEDAPVELVDEVVEVARALHADRELASVLGPPRPIRDTFLGYYIGICEGDLTEAVAVGSPPFVDEDLFAWMRAEVARLRAACERSSAFDGTTATPIHGDLWPGNVLVAEDGRWWIVDWDDMSIGDPVHDIALLCFEAVHEDVSPERWLDAFDAAAQERFALMMRATSLIGVVDSLADWVEAAKVPEHVEAVRAGKERDHRWCLERHRALYP